MVKDSNYFLRTDFEELLDSALCYVGYPASVKGQLTSQDTYLTSQKEYSSNKNTVDRICRFKMYKIISFPSLFFPYYCLGIQKGDKSVSFLFFVVNINKEGNYCLSLTENRMIENVTNDSGCDRSKKHEKKSKNY